MNFESNSHLNPSFTSLVFLTEIERNIEQKTSQAIKKLEKQFKATFMAYTSENKTADETHPNLERAFRSLNVREKRK